MIKIIIFYLLYKEKRRWSRPFSNSLPAAVACPKKYAFGDDQMDILLVSGDVCKNTEPRSLHLLQLSSRW